MASQGLMTFTKLVTFSGGVLLATAFFPRIIDTRSRSFTQQSVGQTFLATLQTGDLVMFNQPEFVKYPLKWLLSQLKKEANNDSFEDVGIVFRHPEENYPYILQFGHRGLTMVNFEDRVLKSNAQDILVRSCHFIRSENDEVDALVKVSSDLNSSLGDGAFDTVQRWLYQMYAYSYISIQNLRAPRAAPQLKRMLNFDEIKDALDSGKNEFGEMRDRDVDNENSFSSFATSSKNKKTSSHAANRVSIYGELHHTIRMLQQSERMLNSALNTKLALDEENSSIYNTIGNFFGAGQSWGEWLGGMGGGLFDNTPKINTYGNIHANIDVEKKTSTLSEEEQENNMQIHLLIRRRDFLASKVQELYEDYRNRTLSLITPSPSNLYNLFNPFKEGASPVFPDVAYVIDTLHSMGITVPSHDGFGYSSTEDVLKQMPEKAPVCPEDFKKPENSKILPSYDYSTLFRILAQHPPRSREYFPHDLRHGSYLKLQRAVLGEEQFVVQSFNQPEWEFADYIPPEEESHYE